MNVALLKQYNIHFSTIKNSRGEIENHAEGGGLAEFLDDIYSSRDVSDGIALAALYLGGGQDPHGDDAIIANAYAVYIAENTATVVLFIDHTLPTLQELPLQDFHDIMVMWRDYLIQNGF